MPGWSTRARSAYGNHFVNSYYPSRDWTGVQISPRFDSSSSTRARTSGSATPSPPRRLGHVDSTRDGPRTWSACRRIHYGHGDYLAYVKRREEQVRNTEPIVTPRGIHREPTQDMYFKGALFLKHAAERHRRRRGGSR